MGPVIDGPHHEQRALSSVSAGFARFVSLALLIAPSSAPAAEVTFESAVAPFIAKHCASCHDSAKKKGDLVLDGYKDGARAALDREVWEKVAARVRAAEMPPRTRPRPEEAEVRPFLSWVDGALGIVPGKRDPGRVTMRRLNAYEYNYTTRDLLGIDLKLGDGFPDDDAGYGFDNIGDVLTLPPLLLERYLAAAERLADEAIVEDVAKAKGKLPEPHRRIVFLEPDPKVPKKERARRIVERFATRAWRRPATSAEVNRLLDIFNMADREKETFERAIQVVVQAILVSPHFLFRVELDGGAGSAEAVEPVTDWQLASRLSYFLWSSMPDEELFEHARKGTLREAAVLEQQARRLLADGKSRGLLKTFASLWLGSRKMKTVTPDTDRFPSFDEDLRTAMRTETELFFQEVMAQDLSILVFIDSDFTFLNKRLAKHYGIQGVEGKEHRKVKLEGERRGGVLTQGTVLTATSNPTRTSPVKRGRWILEQILGTPPPPPPPGVDVLPEEGGAELTGTLRQRMDLHRKDPSCASCHGKMDPLGFAFENYDAVGAWREKDGDAPVDPSGVLPDGGAFRGVKELKAILLSQKDLFARCLAEKMMTFALGRGVEARDRPAIDRVCQALAANDYRFSTLVIEIVKSDPFLYRRGRAFREP